MSAEADARRIEGLIDNAQFAKALWLLRDAFARSPRDVTLLRLAAKLAQAAQSKAGELESSKATEHSRHAEEVAAIAREASDYLMP
jgi:hypothetical protein